MTHDFKINTLNGNYDGASLFSIVMRNGKTIFTFPITMFSVITKSNFGYSNGLYTFVQGSARYDTF